MPVLLVIDDDRPTLDCFRLLFPRDTAQVLTAASADDGLKQFAKVRPDVVVLDVRLPDMSGLEAFRRFQEIDPKVPIILVTGFGTAENYYRQCSAAPHLANVRVPTLILTAADDPLVPPEPFAALRPSLKTSPGLASGFNSFAFHPGFASNGLFYTVHTEFVGSTPPTHTPAPASVRVQVSARISREAMHATGSDSVAP